jgi:plasmid stabilization system protein ParE
LVYVIWADPALDDLRAIGDYIESRSPGNARRFCLDLYESSDRLRNFPRSGQAVPEFGLDHIREILFGNYRIIYRVADGACYVMAVIHGSWDIARHIDPKGWAAG